MLALCRPGCNGCNHHQCEWPAEHFIWQRCSCTWSNACWKPGIPSQICQCIPSLWRRSPGLTCKPLALSFTVSHGKFSGITLRLIHAVTSPFAGATNVLETETIKYQISQLGISLLAFGLPAVQVSPASWRPQCFLPEAARPCCLLMPWDLLRALAIACFKCPFASD